MLRVICFIKQVPDTSSKAGVNPDGTIDRVSAKRMLNTFDRYALQKAIELKSSYGAEITCATMGPPFAMEVLVEGLEHGADYGILLTDRRLPASDTLATAYALTKLIEHFGPFDIILTGLQTTDGDTAQVGPQIAERIGYPQVSYCEQLSLEGTKVFARRVIEGGFQELQSALPVLITIANSATPLELKKFHNVAQVKGLLRNPAQKGEKLRTVSLDDIGADASRVGIVGSPTVVGKTWKLGEIGGNCVMFMGESAEHEVKGLMERLGADNRGVEELINA
jgi:electron transfer flavoprotein beta subunit